VYIVYCGKLIVALYATLRLGVVMWPMSATDVHIQYVCSFKYLSVHIRPGND